MVFPFCQIVVNEPFLNSLHLPLSSGCIDRNWFYLRHYRVTIWGSKCDSHCLLILVMVKHITRKTTLNFSNLLVTSLFFHFLHSCSLSHGGTVIYTACVRGREDWLRWATACVGPVGKGVPGGCLLPWSSDNAKTPFWQPLAAAAVLDSLDLVALPKRKKKVQQAHKYFH